MIGKVIYSMIDNGGQLKPIKNIKATKLVRKQGQEQIGILTSNCLFLMERSYARLETSLTEAAGFCYYEDIFIFLFIWQNCIMTSGPAFHYGQDVNY